MRAILARYLRARGHEVTEVNSAEAARAVLASQTVDVMLLDVNLSDSTCWDILRSTDKWEIQDPCWVRPRVVILSAVPPSPSRLQQFKPDGVLNKPFPIEALSRLVESDCVASESEPGFD